jgi:mRNA interferase MazF
VVSHDSLNGFEVPVVLPITRTRRGYPTHVELDGVLGEVCYVQCELVTAVSAKRLGRKLGRIGIVELAEIEKILRRILVL